MPEKSSTLDLGNLLFNITQSAKLTGLETEIANIQNVQKDILSSTTEIKKANEELSSLQKQNIEIQKQSLLQQEIQTKIQIQEALNNKKQKDLKNVIFAINKSIDQAFTYEDNLTKLVYLDLIQKDIVSNEIDPNQFEEINDKEYASKTFDKIKERRLSLLSDFSDDELLDLRIIQVEPPLLKELKSNLEMVQEGPLSMERMVKNIEDNIKSLEIKIRKKQKKSPKWGIGKQIIAIIAIFLIIGIAAAEEIFWLALMGSFAEIILIVVLIYNIIKYLIDKVKKTEIIIDDEYQDDETEKYLSELSALKSKLENIDAEFETIVNNQDKMVQEANDKENLLNNFFSKYPRLDFLRDS